MRYKNIAEPGSATPLWHPVGLESFCIYPRIVPQGMADELPDPIQINGNKFYLRWPAGELTMRAISIDAKYLEFADLEFVKATMGFVDIFGEYIDTIEWVPEKLFKPGAQDTMPQAPAS